MIWRKTIHDDLTGCSALCDAFATDCSAKPDVEELYRGIILSLDCADICRQLAVLYVRGSENTRLMAKACIEVCTKCAQEVNRFDSAACRQVYAICQQTILSCATLVDIASRAEPVTVRLPVTPASLFYGIDLRETLYN